ncbi:hypothetical protein SUGI_0631220 [Cryptomeria japonica]|nr:hypothetical protein SUGI_0631220 [Cryptomeria japonica]
MASVMTPLLHSSLGCINTQTKFENHCSHWPWANFKLYGNFLLMHKLIHMGTGLHFQIPLSQPLLKSQEQGTIVEAQHFNQVLV